MDFEFLRDVKKDLPAYTHVHVDAMIDTLNESSKGYSSFDYLSNENFITGLVRASSWSSGKASFYRRKKALLALYEVLFERGLVDSPVVSYVDSLTFESFSLKAETDACYFSTLDAAINFVEFVGQQYGCSPDDVSNISSVILLSWYGLSPEEIVDIKKEIIPNDGPVKIKVPFYGLEERTLDDRSTHILKVWRDVYDHSPFPSSKLQHLVDSEYLMRSAKSEKMSANNLFCMIRRFNEEGVQYGKKISLNAVKKNGLFDRVWECKLSGSPMKTIQSLTGCDKQTAFGYSHQYNAFVHSMKGG